MPRLALLEDDGTVREAYLVEEADADMCLRYVLEGLAAVVRERLTRETLEATAAAREEAVAQYLRPVTGGE